MSAGKKIRRFLASVLALTVLGTVFVKDIRISRAETCAPERTEAPEDAGSEETLDRTGSDEKPEESALEARDGTEPEDGAEEAQDGTGPEGKPEETGPETGAGKVAEEDPGEKPGDLSEEETDGSKDSEVKEEGTRSDDGNTAETGRKGPEEEPDEDLGTEVSGGPEAGPDADQKDGTGGLPESASNETLIGTLPEATQAKLYEAGPVPVSLAGRSGRMLLAEEEETSYPVYVSSPEVTFQDSAGSNVLYVGNIKLAAVETTAGETVSSQHRSTLNVRCSQCANMIYTQLPMTYAEVSLSYSDPSMIGEHEYRSAPWTTDDKGRDSGCMQLDSEVLKPGSTDVEIRYSIRYTDFWNPKGQCPLCGGWMPRRGGDTRWYQYKGTYRINAYADYTLRYDANAGGATVEDLPEPETERVYADTAELVITDQKPYRYGYNFVGWAEKKNAGIRDYLPGEKVTLNWTEGTAVEKTLYAVWEKAVTEVKPADPEPEVPDLTYIKKACGTDALTPVTSVETGEEYCYVVTVRNNMEHGIENLSVSEVLDTDLIQLLNISPDYENGIWKLDHLDAGETAVLVLNVKALAEDPAYENVIHILVKDADGKDKEILPGPDDQPSAVVEIRAAQDPPPEDPDPPEEEPEDPEEPDPTPDPIPDPPSDPAPDPSPDSPPDPTPDPPSGSTPDPTPDPPSGPTPVSVSPPEPASPAPIPSVPVFRPAVREAAETAVPIEDHPVQISEAPAEQSEPSSGPIVETKDSRTPLAGRGHLCCILHFVIMLLALLVELFYMRSMKKHQSKIFELRRELEDAEL